MSGVADIEEGAGGALHTDQRACGCSAHDAFWKVALSLFANAAAQAILAFAPHSSMLANAAAPTILASAPLSAMLANIAAPTLLAFAPLPSMLTNAAAPTILADVPHPSMLANAAAPTILAKAPLPSMLANAAAPTILAAVPHSSMLANTAAATLLAVVPHPSMLANAAAPTILAKAPLPSMLAAPQLACISIGGWRRLRLPLRRHTRRLFLGERARTRHRKQRGRLGRGSTRGVASIENEGCGGGWGRAEVERQDGGGGGRKESRRWHQLMMQGASPRCFWVRSTQPGLRPLGCWQLQPPRRVGEAFC